MDNPIQTAEMQRRRRIADRLLTTGSALEPSERYRLSSSIDFSIWGLDTPNKRSQKPMPPLSEDNGGTSNPWGQVRASQRSQQPMPQLSQDNGGPSNPWGQVAASQQYQQPMPQLSQDNGGPSNPWGQVTASQQYQQPQMPRLSENNGGLSNPWGQVTASQRSLQPVIQMSEDNGGPSSRWGQATASQRPLQPVIQLSEDNGGPSNPWGQRSASQGSLQSVIQLSDDNGGPSNPANQQQPHDEQQDVRRLLVMPTIYIPPEQRKQTPRQMACTLMEHQKVCLTWLIQQERDINKKGGILADTMGLGKTIQALALILARPSTDRSRKTTLIVAPLALLRQWEQEIASKIKKRFRLNTVIFHGSYANKKISAEALMKFDIVLCTYGRLRSEYQILTKKDNMTKLRILAPGSRFHRAILDEAHNIKNKDAQVSKAAATIQARYKLCMTGTPFMNRATELFPLIRFLGIAPYNDWSKFSEDIDRPISKWEGDLGSKAMRKLQILFRSITLRRTKDARLDGQPILKLPKRQDLSAYAKFDPEQEAFYRALECKQQLKFNKYLKAGTVMQNYMRILVLLLRLRQVCDHPHLIKSQDTPEGASLDVDEMLKLILTLDEDVVESLKAQDNFECPMCDEKTVNPVHVHPCGHHICMQCFTASMVVRDNAGINLNEVKSKLSCPHDGCEEQILPNAVFMHNIFLDAQMAGSDADSEGEMFDANHLGDADDEDNEYFDENGNLRGPVSYAGREIITLDGNNDSDDQWENPYDSLCVTQSPEPDGNRDSPGLFVTQSPEPDGNRGSPGLFVTQSPEPDGNRGSHMHGLPDDPMAETAINSPYDDNVTKQEPDWQNFGHGQIVHQNNNSMPLKGSAGNPVDIDNEDDLHNFRALAPGPSYGYQLGAVKREDGESFHAMNMSPMQGMHQEPHGALQKRPMATEDNTSRKRSRMAMPLDESNHIDEPQNNNIEIPRPSVEEIDPDEEEAEEEVEEIGIGSSSRKKAGKRKASNKEFVSLGKLRITATRSAAAMHRYRQRVRAEWVSSAKIDKIMEILRDIRQRRPKEKTLVFSLWTSFLDLLEVPVEDEGMGFTRYDGSMRPDTRDAAVKNFMKNPNIDVMLVSLTAGNAGLNLTAATQVIIVEPFWNPFVEEQAIDRSHRIGQKRPVTVHRVLVKGTVEDRILQLQNKKRSLVDAALSEDGANFVGRLSANELQGLFNV